MQPRLSSPCLEPAVNAIEAVEDTGKLAGSGSVPCATSLPKRSASQRSYADMGADHAGPHCSTVLWATKPVRRSILHQAGGCLRGRPPNAGRLRRTGLEPIPAVWREFKTVDLACGSGTLLAAILADMKRRAQAKQRRLRDMPALPRYRSWQWRRRSRAWTSTRSRYNWRLRNSPPEITNITLSTDGAPFDAIRSVARRSRSGSRVAVGTLGIAGSERPSCPRDNELDLADDKDRRLKPVLGTSKTTPS